MPKPFLICQWYEYSGGAYYISETDIVSVLRKFSNTSIAGNASEKWTPTCAERNSISVLGSLQLFIWQQKNLNGKETPQGSFLKFTGHQVLKKLKISGTSHMYEVNAANKKHEIWQRDSLSVEIYSREVARQKLDYIPARPVRRAF